MKVEYDKFKIYYFRGNSQKLKIKALWTSLGQTAPLIMYEGKELKYESKFMKYTKMGYGVWIIKLPLLKILHDTKIIIKSNRVIKYQFGRKSFKIKSYKREIFYDDVLLNIDKMKFEVFKNEKGLYKNIMKSFSIKELLIAKIILIHKKLINKKIVILTDRYDSADDNAMYFLKYIYEYRQDLKKEYKFYFAVSKKTKNYSLIKKMATTLDPGGMKYLLLLTNADKIISSQMTPWIRRPWAKNKAVKITYPFCDYSVYFIQHGIIANDISKVYNVANTTVDLFLTSTTEELELIKQTQSYGYDTELKLIGLPRLDYYKKANEEKKIMFFPSWRKNIIGSKKNNGNEYEYCEEFKNSDFLKNINEMLMNQKFNNLLEKENYTLILIPHQNLSAQLNDFKGGKRVKIIESSKISIQNELQTSEIFITDFSSVAFDALYANKMVLQFYSDEKNILINHSFKPDNRFQKPGKELCDKVRDVDDLIDKLTIYFKNKKKYKEKYKKNINELFDVKDEKNSKKLCDLIFN